MLWCVLGMVLHAVLKCCRQQRSHRDFVTDGKLFLPLQSPNEQKYERLGTEEIVEVLQAATHALIHLHIRYNKLRYRRDSIYHPP